jgi:hypothetical protein
MFGSEGGCDMVHAGEILEGAKDLLSIPEVHAPHFDAEGGQRFDITGWSCEGDHLVTLTDQVAHQVLARKAGGSRNKDLSWLSLLLACWNHAPMCLVPSKKGRVPDSADAGMKPNSHRESKKNALHGDQGGES